MEYLQGACTIVLNSLAIGFGIGFLKQDVNDTFYQPPYLFIWCILTILTLMLQNIGSVYEAWKLANGRIDTADDLRYFKNFFNIVILFVSFVLFIWGWVIYHKLHHLNMPVHIWTWFSVILLVNTIAFGLLTCCCPCLLMASYKQRRGY